jgi:hypothetical protein
MPQDPAKRMARGPRGDSTISDPRREIRIERSKSHVKECRSADRPADPIRVPRTWEAPVVSKSPW